MGGWFIVKSTKLGNLFGGKKIAIMLHENFMVAYYLHIICILFAYYLQNFRIKRLDSWWVWYLE